MQNWLKFNLLPKWLTPLCPILYADNVNVSPSGSTPIAADDVGGVLFQRVKLSCGSDGSATDVTIGGGVEAAALRVTIASDSTGVLSVDDNGGSLTVDGTVAVSAVVPGTGATNLGKAEDSAHSSADVGVMALAVRSDAGGATGADGDYVPLLTDANGALYVTGGGGGTQYVEDAAAASNPTGTAQILIRADSLAGVTSADGDNVAARGTDKGELYVKHVDSIPVTDNSGSLTVDNAGTFAVQATIAAGATTIAKAEDAAHSSADVGVSILGVRRDSAASGAGTDGDYATVNLDANGKLWANAEITASIAIPVTDNSGSLTVDNAALSVTGGGVEASALRVTIASDSTGVVSVDDNGSSLTVDNGGTFAVQATVAAGATNIAKAEDVASADADVGVPAMAIRQASPANSSGTDGDYEMLKVSSGRQWTISCLDTDSIMSAGAPVTPKFAVIDNATSGDNTIVAAVSSKKIRVHSLFIVVASAVTVRFESGAGGTALTGQMQIAANGGFVLPFNPAGWFETASNTLLNLELSGAVSVDGSLQYTEI